MATDITIIKGDDKNLVVTVTDDNGDAIDITGYTIFFTAKTNQDDIDANAVISKDVTSHTSPSEGISTIALASSDTDVTAGRYWYDIQIKDTSGKITSTSPYTLTITQDITERTS